MATAQMHGGNGSGNNGDFTEAEHLRKIFIGGLAPTTTNETLQQYFEQWGNVVDVVVMKDSKTQKSRGFGFVTYSESSMVDAAQQARPHSIDGRNIEAKRAIPREDVDRPEISAVCKKIYVGRLNPDVTDDDLRESFADFGNVTSVNVVKDKEGNSRGYGFVEFDDNDPVDKIVLQKDHEIKGQPVDVKKSQPKPQGGPGNGNFGGRGNNQNDGFRGNNRMGDRNWGNNQGNNFGNQNSGYGNQGNQFGNTWSQNRNSGGGFNNFGNGNTGSAWGGGQSGGFNGNSNIWSGNSGNSSGRQSFGNGNSGNRNFANSGGNNSFTNFRNSNDGQFNNGGGNRNFANGGNKFGGGNQMRNGGGGGGMRNHPYGNRNAINEF